MGFLGICCFVQLCNMIEWVLIYVGFVIVVCLFLDWYRWGFNWVRDQQAQWPGTCLRRRALVPFTRFGFFKLIKSLDFYIGWFVDLGYKDLHVFSKSILKDGSLQWLSRGFKFLIFTLGWRMNWVILISK